MDVVEAVEFVEAAVGQLGGFVDDLPRERAHPGHRRRGGHRSSSGPSRAGAERGPDGRRRRTGRGLGRAPGAGPDGDVERGDIEIGGRSVAPARPAGHAEVRRPGTPPEPRDVEPGRRVLVAPAAGRIDARDRAVRAASPAEVEVGRGPLEQARERGPARGAWPADDGLRPVLAVVVELERVVRPGVRTGVGHRTTALRPGSAPGALGRPVRRRRRDRGGQVRAPDGLAQRGGLLAARHGRRGGGARHRPRSVRGARRGAAVGLPGARGGRRHRAQRTRDPGPASGRGRRDVARTGRRRRWRVPGRARTPVRPRRAVPCAGAAGGRDRPQRSRCRRPPLPDGGRHGPHRAGRRRALSTVRHAVRRDVRHRTAGRAGTVRAFGVAGGSRRTLPVPDHLGRPVTAPGHGRAAGRGTGGRAAAVPGRRRVVGLARGPARPGVGRVRAPVRPAATDRRRWRDRPVRALTAPPAATPARAAFAVLGEQLGDGALPRVVDLRTHRLHRASSVVSVPGPSRARCAERSVMRARASDADARPRGGDAQGSAG